MARVCAVSASIYAQELLFNNNQVSSNNFVPKIELYVSIRRSSNISGMYGLRRYIRMNRTLFFRSNFYRQFFSIGGMNYVQAPVFQNLASRSISIHVSYLALDSQFSV